MEFKTPFKELSRKAKVQYIWDYYRLHILFGAFALFLIISFIVNAVTRKEEILQILMINSSMSSETEDPLPARGDAFLEQYGYNQNKQELAFNRNLFVTSTNDYMDLSTVNMMIATQAYGALISDLSCFENLSNQQIFVDLSTILTESQLEEYQDDLYYVTDPETNKDYPCGIRLTADTSWVVQDGLYFDECYYGVLYQKEQTNAQTEFTNYVLTK